MLPCLTPRTASVVMGAVALGSSVGPAMFSSHCRYYGSMVSIRVSPVLIVRHSSVIPWRDLTLKLIAISVQGNIDGPAVSFSSRWNHGMPNQVSMTKWCIGPFYFSMFPCSHASRRISDRLISTKLLLSITGAIKSARFMHCSTPVEAMHAPCMGTASCVGLVPE